jgi:CRISPR-associated endonuclease Cas2
MALYWAVYDISKNKNRTAVVGVLKNRGFVRVQKSVFLGNVSRNVAEMVALDTRPHLSHETDALFLFPACASCFEARIIHGRLDDERVKEKDYHFVG